MRRDPIADLQRIAFLLERTSESTYRIQAFRRAAVALARISPEELEKRSGAESLAELPGIGTVTARCIAESLAGEEPVYLRRLESTADQPLAESTLALRQLLRGDCHSHSEWSDGSSTIPDMTNTAQELGHDYLAVTDHSPRLTVANGLTADRLRAQLAQIYQLNQELAPFRILTGIEVDILTDGALDQDDDLLAQLDVVVASVHSELSMDSAEMTARMVRAIRNPLVDVLGHCTGRLLSGRRRRPESTFDPEQVFSACQTHGVAVEINSRPERLDPPKRLLRLAVEAGCVFAIDSDGHAPGQLDWQTHGCARAAACGVRPADVVNTWAANELLAWTADHSYRPR